MAQVIVLSGACYSGKTTAMNTIKKYLEDKGKKVIISDEYIRHIHDIKSIDELRQHPSAYLNIQVLIAQQKIKTERELFEQYKHKDDVYIICDRSILDSIYYLCFYLDKSQLTTSEIACLGLLLSTLLETTEEFYTKYYDVTLLFKPIIACSNNKDSMRPKDLIYVQQNEYRLIKLLYLGYCFGIGNKTRFVEFDYNLHTDEQLLLTLHKYNVI
jgi:hypothetical protein